jgi:hypothetical protein
MTDKPYTDKSIEGSENCFQRTFSSSVDTSELVFHRDKKDRTIVACQNEGEWKLQMDNEVPAVVGEGMFIPKEIYHRLIKGKGDLTVTIKEEGE